MNELQSGWARNVSNAIHMYEQHIAELYRRLEAQDVKLTDLQAKVDHLSKTPTNEQSEPETPLKIGDTVEIVSYAYAYQTTDKMDADIFKRMGFIDHNVNVCTPHYNGCIGQIFAIDRHSKNQELLYGVDLPDRGAQILITRKGLKVI